MLICFVYIFAGQTPIMLAEDDDEMVSFLKNHLIDVQNTGPNKMPWKFQGAWNINGKSRREFKTMWLFFLFFFWGFVYIICVCAIFRSRHHWF